MSCLFQVLSVSHPPIGRPLVATVPAFDESFGQQAFEVAQEDDVKLSVVVDPACIASVRVATLCFAAFARVENLVERTFVYVPQNHIQILANRHIAVGMNHQLVEDTVATQPQALIFPLVVERHEIEVFVRFVDRRRNLPQEIGVCRVDQSRSGVEKRHRAVDTDAHIDAIALGHGNDVLHVAE